MEFICAMLPVTKPFMSWPEIKLNAPGDNSSIFIKSLEDSVILKSTGT